jgi:hypothetical protein
MQSLRARVCTLWGRDAASELPFALVQLKSDISRLLTSPNCNLANKKHSYFSRIICTTREYATQQGFVRLGAKKNAYHWWTYEQGLTGSTPSTCFQDRYT